jgi:hypothetical protein
MLTFTRGSSSRWLVTIVGGADGAVRGGAVEDEAFPLPRSSSGSSPAAAHLTMKPGILPTC